jgi:RimJ/RimL family protein N-acetyltransferase
MSDEIETTFDGVVLRPLSSSDAKVYADLANGNRDHLTRYGDFREMFPVTLAAARDELMRDDGVDRFGLWHGTSLIGRFDLTPREAGNFVLGYWLDGAHTGRGFATAACTALIAYARSTRGATDIWAGVTKGNVASRRLLMRVGLLPVEDMGSYTRFHRHLEGD